MAAALAVATPASAQDTFRFGLATPLTGSQALYGQDQVKAAEWAVAEMNKAGGINGKKLRYDRARYRSLSATRHRVRRPALVSVEKVPVFVTAWSAVVKAVAPSPTIIGWSNSASAPIARHRQARRLCLYDFPLADIDIKAVAKYAATPWQEEGGDRLYNNETGARSPVTLQEGIHRAAGRSSRTKRTIRRRWISPDRCSKFAPPIRTLSTCRAWFPTIPSGHCADASAWSDAADHFVFGGVQSEAGPAAGAAAEGVICDLARAGRGRIGP